MADSLQPNEQNGSGSDEFGLEAETLLAQGTGNPAHFNKAAQGSPTQPNDTNAISQWFCTGCGTPNRVGVFCHECGLAKPETTNPWAPESSGTDSSFDSQSFSRPIMPGVVLDSVSAVPDPIFEPEEQAIEPEITPELLHAPLGDSSSSQQIEEQEFDATVLAKRLSPSWVIETSQGQKVKVLGQSIILGRKLDPAQYPAQWQVIVLDDPEKTVSKVHARLDLVNEKWIVTDLNSSNGVVIYREDGSEEELVGGASAQINEKILLGNITVYIRSMG
jgi:pSer/pThr/pTyr-binding forkhead associated (FHA) protein